MAGRVGRKCEGDREGEVDVGRGYRVESFFLYFCHLPPFSVYFITFTCPRECSIMTRAMTRDSPIWFVYYCRIVHQSAIGRLPPT